ncbi:MAG: helix-turn-helix transcriptional regulator [Planctomycetota bacterium]
MHPTLRPVRRGEFIQNFGERVRAKRTGCGWTQEDLAHASGLHRTMIGHVEQGTRNATLETIEKLARALQVQPAELMPPIAFQRRGRTR